MLRYRRGASVGVVMLVAGLGPGCTSLKPVAQFAREGAQLCADTATLDREAGTSTRELPYLSPAGAEEARRLGASRARARTAMVTLHRSVARYLEALARVAGDGAFSLKGDVAALARAGAEALPADEAKAVVTLAGLTERWGTAGLQRRAVRRMLAEGEAPFQDALGGLQRLVRIQQETLHQERRLVEGFLETEMAFLDPGRDRLLKALAEAHRQERSREFSQAARTLEGLARALARLGEGHRRLAQAGPFDRETMKEALPQIARDLQEARLALRALRS